MVENTVTSILAFTFFAVILYIFSLRTSQYLNVPRILYISSIISSCSIVFICVYLRLKSSQFISDNLIAFALGGLTTSTSFKILELSFTHKWTYTQKMPMKLVVLYFLALPQMPESEEKLLEISKQNVRRECITPILQGICKYIIFRVILHLVPMEWLSFSPSFTSPVVGFLRYGLLGIILYLSIDSVTSTFFGVYTFIFNIRMNPVFPSFPFFSTSLRDFWSYRWNNLVKNSLHLISSVIIPKFIDPLISTNKIARALFAYLLSGCLHEYILWLVCRKWFGKSMIFFLLHCSLVLLEIKMNLPRKATTFQGKLIGWIWTMSIMYVTVPLFFDPFIEVGVFASMK